MRSAVFALCLIVLWTSPLSAATLYVNNAAGNDRYDGQSAQQSGERLGPVRTIQRALRLATSSDRIVLANTGVPYRESITLFGRSNSGLEDFPFIIDGNGAILEGADPVPQDGWRPYSHYIFRFRPPGLGHQQLFRDARPLARHPVVNPSMGLPKLEPLEWAMHGSQIYFHVEQDKIPREYALTYAARTTGITMVHARHVVIRDLIVQGFRVDGINLHTADNDCELLGVIARGNGRSGVTVGPASSVRIDQCVIGSNGHAQIRTESGGVAHVTNSEVFADTAPLWYDAGGRLSIDGREIQDPKDVEADAAK
ncbi:MAG: right-handed parallel beta-helix repeat-containing protein [Pirellulales bacterium]|nr:right-handed parallel beta-helix repeat-containing protein [Pirellulales bacterium]